MIELHLKNIKDLHNWLEENYKSTEGIWLIYEKGIHRKIAHGEIVDELLCFGWIDSTAGTVDETRTKIYVAPRNPKSKWSKVNKDKVERLLKENRIQENGLKMINLAKETGTWDALNDVENLVIPEDLEKEFKKYKVAKENFLNFPKSAKKFALQWILDAKRPETRISRIDKVASTAEQGVRIAQ